MQTPGQRKCGEKLDITVYAQMEDYASFPQLARTDNALVLLFQVQNLAKLRAAAEHPHYQKMAVPRWAISRDGGLTWKINDSCPLLGRVQDISYGSAPLADGGTVTLTFNSTEPLRAIIQHGRIGYRPYQDAKAETGEIHAVTDMGPFSRFYPHCMTRTADGKIIAGGYVPFKAPDGKSAKTTVAFLASTDEGRTWQYLSHIPNETMLDFCEPAILPTKDGRLLVVMRIEGDRKIIVKEYPAEARAEIGYFLYQAESCDSGRTWTVPVQLSLWGHPPYLTRLASGNILFVYGHRREPYEIRAVLSRDEGRTWDLTTLRTVHRFEPGNYDLGYPVATQIHDGSIICAYYGYSTENIGEKMPHGIFVSVFDEAWLYSSS